MAPSTDRGAKASKKVAAPEFGARTLEDLLPPPRLHRVIAPDGKQVGDMPAIDVDTMLRMYRSMLEVRLLDERMMIMQRQGRIGFYGSCTGQEAPPVGAVAALAPGEWIFPALREGVAMLYRGFPLDTYICQVLGNSGDLLKGRQMPSHYAARSVAYVSWSSCIGTQISQAVGAAWALHLKKERGVTVAFMGDGATSSQEFHVGLNFAGVFKTPCILICQNNHWSISVPTKCQTASRTIAEKAFAYGIPYARVDGNDVLAVFGAVKEAREHALNGGGASFLEMVTYRIGAHSSSDDPRVYRDEREVDEWKTQDPLERFRKFLIGKGHWSEARETEERALLDAKILAAVDRAEHLPPPKMETLFEDVFSEIPEELKLQSRELL